MELVIPALSHMLIKIQINYRLLTQMFSCASLASLFASFSHILTHMYKLSWFILLPVVSAPSSTMPPPMPNIMPNTPPEGHLGKRMCLHEHYSNIMCITLPIAPTPSPTMPPPVPMAILDALPEVREFEYAIIHYHT